MIRQRFSTFLTTASLLLTMTAVSVAAPASTLGAIANVNVGGGIVIGNTATRATTPLQVSPGNVVGFYLWAKNNDAAGLSSFFLTASTDLTFKGAVWKHPGDATTQTCGSDVNGRLNCAFGALNSTDEILVLAAFTVPPPASSSPANCLSGDALPNSGFNHGSEASWVCVDFQFASNSGYVVQKGKNKSRGDAYHWYDSVATNVTEDQGAGFPFCDSNVSVCDGTNSTLSVQNGGTATGSDVQTTHLKAPPAAFNTAFDTSGLFGKSGLAVADNFFFVCPSGSGVPTCANHQANGQTGFVGQWSRVDANTEQPFGDAFIQVDLSMFGVKPQDINGVMHLWEGPAGVWTERPITALCPGPDGPATLQTTECFWATGAGNVTTVSIWAHNNGTFRTF
jgi:hypothetical protein